MKANKILVFLGISILILFLFSCEKNKVIPTTAYGCNFVFQDSSAIHPKADIYQNILENNRDGLVGAVLLVKDKNGLWMGAEGQADIASDVDMQTCNTFLIASISKVFTSAAVYRYIDKGILSLDDPINQWLDETIVDRVANANQAQIKHLLAHTSGIPDLYTFQMILDMVNDVSNGWTKEQLLEHVYGVNATNEVGEAYSYSNTNYLLLSIILENASGLSFEEVYQQEVFNPLNLSSAYYSEEKPIPDGLVKGYMDIYGNGQYIESEFVYNDEIGVGGDGGIVINAYDTAIFFEELMKGNLISASSLNEMTNWFDLPEDYHWQPFGQTENGFGIEKFNTSYGAAVGHSGGIGGFSTLALYSPQEDMTYILFVNSVGNESAYTSEKNIFLETMEEMFE